MGVKALVHRREKSLLHRGGWCRAPEKVLQGLKGAIGRSRSRSGAAQRLHVRTRTRQSVWLCLICQPLNVKLLLTHLSNYPLLHVFSA